MRLATRTALVAALAFSGCHTSPFSFVGHHRTDATPAATSTPEPPPAAPQITATPPVSSTPRPVPSVRPLATPTAEPKKPPVDTVEPPPSPAAQPSASLDFPTAKPVEGKPGFVYSPFEEGKYVDVSGYAPGSKVKDPYSGKIFLVP